MNSASRNYLQQIQVPGLGCVHNHVTSPRKRIFTIVSRPTLSQVKGKTIRHILIFDNHPDTTGNELSIVSIIGIILLIGIVKKNAIMMVDFALEAERHEGLAPEESIYQACLIRFRPIMMTTMAALFGALPLAIGMGVGSELRQPLGIAIVGGLIVSQMLTLYTTPVIYLFLDQLRQRGKKRRTEPVEIRPLGWTHAVDSSAS